MKNIDKTKKTKKIKVFFDIVFAFFSPKRITISLVLLLVVTAAVWCHCVNLSLDIIIAIATCILTVIAIFVAVRINESVQASECTRLYFSSDMLNAIHCLRENKDYIINEFENTPEMKSLCWLPRTRQLNILCPKKFDGQQYDYLNHFKDKEKLEKLENKEELEKLEKLDGARRTVKAYFQLIYELRYKRVIPISKYMLRQLCGVDAFFSLYFDVVERMEAMHNRNYTREPFYYLMKDCGRLLDDKSK